MKEKREDGSAQRGSCIVRKHGHIGFILVTEHCNQSATTDVSAKTGMNVFDDGFPVVCERIITVLLPKMKSFH